MTKPDIDALPLNDSIATDAAYKAWPDETEPLDYEGRTLSKITVDRGNLRFAFVMGANWYAGTPWAQLGMSGPLPAARPASALRTEREEAERLRAALEQIATFQAGQLVGAGDGDTRILRGDEYRALQQIARAALNPGA